jgi:hypothetical protein
MTGHCPERGDGWGNAWIEERLGQRQASWLELMEGLTESLAAAAAELAAMAVAHSKDAMRPSKGQLTHLAETVLVGTVARRSSRMSRIPCGGVANNPDERAVCAASVNKRGCRPPPKEKRKVLDMANKKRNTAAVLRGGLCLQFFPQRLGPLVSRAATLDNPRQHSFLLAPMRQAQNQELVMRQAVSTMSLTMWKPRRLPVQAAALRVAPRRIALRRPQ